METAVIIQKYFITDKIGDVSLAIQVPPGVKHMLVLAHGAGAGMQHAFMESLAISLASHSIGIIRFNFPYMEKGGKRPDTPAVAHKTIERVIEYALQQYPTVPLFAGGKSFGGRMTSQLLSKQSLPIQGVVFFGFPLHPAGEPAINRADHLKDVSVPLLFLQGTRDALAEWSLLTCVVDTLSNATLVKLEGADHAFKSGKKDFIPVLSQATHAWMADISTHQK